jgi:hypothetical protein
MKNLGNRRVFQNIPEGAQVRNTERVDKKTLLPIGNLNQAQVQSVRVSVVIEFQVNCYFIGGL